MNDIVREGRLKIVSVHQNTMVEYLNWVRNPPAFIALPQYDRLPADTFVVAATVNHEFRSIDFIVASAEFEPVEPGCRLEHIDDIGLEWKYIPFSELAGTAPYITPTPDPAQPVPEQ